MAITTYAELQTAVENWLVRTDQTSRVPEFISLAEGEINRKLRIREMESRATATTSSGTATLALPTTSANFISLMRVRLTDGASFKILTALSPSQIVSDYPSTTTGVPEVYAVLGSELEFRPIPNGAYSIEALYLARLSALSASNVPTLFTNNPDLYLYGALAHAIPFVNEPDVTSRLQVFRGMFDRALEEIRIHDMVGRHGGSPLTIRSDVGNP